MRAGGDDSQRACGQYARDAALLCESCKRRMHFLSKHRLFGRPHTNCSCNDSWRCSYSQAYKVSSLTNPIFRICHTPFFLYITDTAFAVASSYSAEVGSSRLRLMSRSVVVTSSSSSAERQMAVAGSARALPPPHSSPLRIALSESGLVSSTGSTSRPHASCRGLSRSLNIVVSTGGSLVPSTK